VLVAGSADGVVVGAVSVVVDGVLAWLHALSSSSRSRIGESSRGVDLREICWYIKYSVLLSLFVHDDTAQMLEQYSSLLIDSGKYTHSMDSVQVGVMLILYFCVNKCNLILQIVTHRPDWSIDFLVMNAAMNLHSLWYHN
jgi:hypothetical protein